MARPRTAGEMKTTFGEDDLVTWLDLFEANIPDTPTPAECLLAPQVTSLQLQSTKTGLTILRVKLHDGQTVTVSLNPVAAKQLAEAIVTAGAVYGWLNSKGYITFPRA